MPKTSPRTEPECLARGDPPGHPAVGADQAQCREPPVAPLAAEAHGRGDEDTDRQQQHHEDDDDQEEEYRVQFVGRSEGSPKWSIRVTLEPSILGARLSAPA